MASWIKADVHFDDRCACFVVTRVDALSFNADQVNGPYAVVRDAIMRTGHEGGIDEIERTVLAMIEKHRPDLRGAILYALSHDPAMMAWKITLSHPSLPKRKPGEFLKLTRLVKEEGVEYVEFDEPTMVT